MGTIDSKPTPGVPRQGRVQTGPDICILGDCTNEGILFCDVHEDRDKELCLHSSRCMAKRVNVDFCQEHTPEPDDAFWTARPVLTHIRAHARAYRSAPWAVLGVTLARVAAAVPPSVVLPGIIGDGEGTLNLFSAITGASGTGKGAAIRTSKGAVSLSTDPYETKLGSGQGMTHVYVQLVKDPETKKATAVQTRDRALFVNTEIDNLTAHASQTAATLLSELRSAWSGETLGQYYVDETKRMIVPENAYRLCLIVGVQPSRARGLMEDAGGGTPQRFLWFPVRDPRRPEVLPPAPDAPWTWISPIPEVQTDPFDTPDVDFVDPDRVPVKHVIKVCDRARKDIDDDFIARTDAGDHAETLDAHRFYSRLKVAAVLGLLDSRLTVTEEDWELAGVIIDYSTATRERVTGTLAEEIKAQAQAKLKESVTTARQTELAKHADKVAGAARRIQTVLGKEAGGWLTHGKLNSALGGAYRDHFPEALDRLTTAGRIESAPTDRGVKYRLRK